MILSPDSPGMHSDCFVQQVHQHGCRPIWRRLYAVNAVGHDPSGAYFISARFRQKFTKLSVPPKRVVKFVESTSTMSAARC
jgi:hypothetical protein